MGGVTDYRALLSWYRHEPAFKESNSEGKLTLFYSRQSLS